MFLYCQDTPSVKKTLFLRQNLSGGCIFVSINLIKPILASGWCFGPALAGDTPNRGILGLKIGF